MSEHNEPGSPQVAQADAQKQIDLLRQVRLALREDDVPAAIGYLQETITLVRADEDRAAEGRHLGNLALLYHRIEQPERALHYFQQALDCAREENDHFTEGGLLGNIGNILREIGRYEAAVDHLNQALVIANENGDLRGRGIWLGNLGLVYDDLSQPAQAIDYHIKSVEIARKLHDQRGLAARLGNLGNSYITQGEYLAALTHFNEAIALFREIGEVSELALRLGIVGNLHAELGRNSADEQQAAVHFGAALQHYTETLEIAKQLGDQATEAQLLRSIGHVLANATHFDDAISYLQAAEGQFTALGLETQAQETHQSLVRCMAYRDRLGM